MASFNLESSISFFDGSTYGKDFDGVPAFSTVSNEEKTYPTELIRIPVIITPVQRVLGQSGVLIGQTRDQAKEEPV